MSFSDSLRMATAEGSKKNTELEQLAEQGEILRKRSKSRRADYKLIDSEIVKTPPEPLPASLKEQIREMLESRVSNDTSANSTIPQQDRSGYITDVSSATWQFSTQSFSPRSVVSINGAAKNDNGLLKVRTDLSPNLRSETSRSNVAVQTTHAEDERPRPHGIMKSRELQTKEQILYGDQPRSVVKQDHWEQREVLQAKPKVTEIIQKVEEHTRREEVERTRLRREKKEKKQRSGYHHGGSHEMVSGYDSADTANLQGMKEYYRRIIPNADETSQNTHAMKKDFNSRESRKETESSYAQTNLETKTSQSQQWARDSEGVQKIYERRAYSPSELNAAVRNAYEAVDRIHQNIRNYRYGSNYRDYRPSHESYMRSSSTRRETKHGSGGQYYDYYNDGRHGSVSDSLRRGEARYIPNGEVREVIHSSRRNDGRMHKSYSTRDVFHSGGHEERRSSSNFYRGSQQNVPFVEFPPTLPRSDHEAPIPPPHRSRSTSNDNEFRDSLLMPLPYVGGYTHKKERRHEQIPGGYETFQHEERSDSGHRFDREGRPTQFSEASQEYSYKRETTSDRRH
ncbi:unnamed protein product [Enterobius vermicularis]|uniref:ZM domain-containing protein n=1 Tax=Enterobius vermicularis TaxID=51028 RepID=A0A0N4V0N7_ENTVE|nr:unnamed protein product [Enterobius vermicularis]